MSRKQRLDRGRTGNGRPERAAAPRAATQPLPHARWFVGAVVIAAFLLRVVDLQDDPPGLWSDEASIGWNAYCLLKTGRNEHGQFLPLSFPSIEKFNPKTWRTEGFWDYKGPVYIYAAVPSVALFGLNAFAVRLPAAVFGTVLVLMAYLLGRRWWGPVAGLAACILAAFSPWGLHYSRIGYGACCAVPLLSVALHLFFAGLERPRWLPLSGALFALAAYAYQVCLLFCPMMMAALALTHFRVLWARRRWALGWVAAAGLLTAPISVRLVQDRMHQGEADSLSKRSRFEYISVFNEQARRDFAAAQARRAGDPTLAESPIFDHWWSAAGYAYTRFWSPQFLVGHGDLQPRNSLTGYIRTRPRRPDEPQPARWTFIGQLLWAEALLAAAGLVCVIRQIRKPYARFLLIWLVSWPIPASLTAESVPQAIRAMVSLPLWQLLGGAAVAWLYGRIHAGGRVQAVAKAGLAGASTLWAGQVIWLLMVLYSIYPLSNEVRAAWDHHVPEMVAYGMEQRQQFARCLVSPSLDKMNTYIAFFTRLDPAGYLAGQRPFMWAEPFDEFRDGNLYLIRVLDERNPALVRLWAEVGVSGAEVARLRRRLGRRELMISATYAELQARFPPGAVPAYPRPPQPPTRFFVTAEVLRAAARRMAGTYRPPP